MCGIRGKIGSHRYIFSCIEGAVSSSGIHSNVLGRVVLENDRNVFGTAGVNLQILNLAGTEALIVRQIFTDERVFRKSILNLFPGGIIFDSLQYLLDHLVFVLILCFYFGRDDMIRRGSVYF